MWKISGLLVKNSSSSFSWHLLFFSVISSGICINYLLYMLNTLCSIFETMIEGKIAYSSVFFLFYSKQVSFECCYHCKINLVYFGSITILSGWFEDRNSVSQFTFIVRGRKMKYQTHKVHEHE